MPWNIRRDFHLDINAAYGSFLIVSATDSSLRQPPPDMVAGDGMPVRFHFWERGANGTLTAAVPGPDTVFIFSGRPAGAPAGSELLFLTNDFTAISAGVWQGTLDLTPAEFSAHIAAEPAGPKIILGELEVRDGASNTQRTSFQFDLTVRPQVYQNDIAPLVIPTPDQWLSAKLNSYTDSIWPLLTPAPIIALQPSPPVNGVGTGTLGQLYILDDGVQSPFVWVCSRVFPVRWTNIVGGAYFAPY